jgi:ATP-dependent RNA helicase DHX29
VNEQRIDFELLEELIAHIDETYEDGAILVFLPGKTPSPPNKRFFS